MRRILLATTATLTLTGCINMAMGIQAENPNVKEVLFGSDCIPVVLGLGVGTASVDGARNKAYNLALLRRDDVHTVRTASIQRVRRAEISDCQFLVFGARCVEVTGE